MRDSLLWLDALPHGTHAFLVEKPISESVLNTRVKDLSRDEKLASGVEDLWRRWRSHPWRSIGDYSTRSLVRAMLRVL